MATPNRTTYAILGWLTVRPMSGYDIKKEIEGSIANFWSESYGQIYPILKRLAAEGAIERIEEPANGKRPRHVYTITNAGRDKLRAWLSAPAEPPPVRIELLLKLFFGAHADHATNRRQIEDYRERMVRDLERYHGITETLRNTQGDHAEYPYWLMTLRFGVRDREAHIAWCAEALELLDQIPTDKRADGSTQPALTTS